VIWFGVLWAASLSALLVITQPVFFPAAAFSLLPMSQTPVVARNRYPPSAPACLYTGLLQAHKPAWSSYVPLQSCWQVPSRPATRMSPTARASW
jgi:hypothetical protein